MTSRLLYRLLPMQILLAGIGSVNGLVASLFANNSVGSLAMSAVTLYMPVNTLLSAISIMMVSGATILCGKYMGKNQTDSMRNIFSLDILLSLLVAAVFTAVALILGSFDLTGFFTTDPQVRVYFNAYLLGQAIGMIPFLLGNQLSAFLSLENKIRKTTIASLIYIIINILLNFLFVTILHMQAFGLALASSLGLWVFFAIEAQYFLSGKSYLRLRLKNLQWKECGEMIKIGIPGAASMGYQTLRGLIVNMLIMQFVGSAGLSAFGVANSLLGLAWAVPNGMLAVSRMMIGVSVGEEDRQTLTDVMRTAMYSFVPVMCAVSAVLIALAVPFTNLYYHDPSAPIYAMTVWGFRILPMCMPFSLICIHFICYGQASNKQVLAHLESLLDGVVCVAGFSALLIPFIGVNGVYIANVLNGVVTVLVVLIYSWIRNKRFPKTMGQLMVIPEEFGVSEENRIDITVRSMEEVVFVAERVQIFCKEKGIDERRAYLAGLSMEEMAGNVVGHGFLKDNRNHSADVRVVYKDDNVILRIKDDCVQFDPAERAAIIDPEDITRNVGIRMVYKIAKEIQYQNILGLNVLTIRI